VNQLDSKSTDAEIALAVKKLMIGLDKECSPAELPMCLLSISHILSQRLVTQPNGAELGKKVIREIKLQLVGYFERSEK
jgi:hypothetical protein